MPSFAISNCAMRRVSKTQISYFSSHRSISQVKVMDSKLAIHSSAPVLFPKFACSSKAQRLDGCCATQLNRYSLEPQTQLEYCGFDFYHSLAILLSALLPISEKLTNLMSLYSLSAQHAQAQVKLEAVLVCRAASRGDTRVPASSGLPDVATFCHQGRGEDGLGCGLQGLEDLLERAGWQKKAGPHYSS